jgi:hypothetical protein
MTTLKRNIKFKMTGGTSLFQQKLEFTMLSGVLAVICLLGMTSISLAQGDTWTFKTPMPTGRGFLSGTVLDGKIYVVGGTDNTQLDAIALVEMYDPVSNTWTTRASMPEARTCPATCTYNGKIYVFGGASPMLNSSAKNTVFEYDPQTDTWTQKANMPHAFRSCGVAVLNDTIYLMGGGSVYFPPDSTVMAYHLLTESWIEKKPMPTARGSISACVVDGKIYAIGGTTEDYHSVSYKLVEVFDPATNTWTQKADMLTGRFGLGTCVLDGKIYAVGGWRGSDVLTINEMYDPATNVWERKSGLQQKRFIHFLGSVGTRIYAIGGAYPQGTQAMLLSSVEEYDPASEPTNVEEVSEAIAVPSGYALSQNCPNPFNPQTGIKYELPHAGKVVLKVYNIVGQEICTLVDEVKPAGSFEVLWDGRDNTGHRVASGMYLYRIEAQGASIGSGKGFVQTRKMLLLQ